MTADKAVLFACFGTSDADQFEKCIYPFLIDCRGSSLSVTSDVVRRKLEMSGYKMPSVREAVDELCSNGSADITVIPLLLADGSEFRKIKETVIENPQVSVKLIDPLLERNPEETAMILSEMYPRSYGRTYVFVGHGSADSDNSAYKNFQCFFREIGRDDVRIILMNGCSDKESFFRATGKQSELFLVPLMLTSGHHAKKISETVRGYCEQEGIKCMAESNGLGTYEKFRNLFTR